MTVKYENWKKHTKEIAFYLWCYKSMFCIAIHTNWGLKKMLKDRDVPFDFSLVLVKKSKNQIHVNLQHIYFSWLEQYKIWVKYHTRTELAKLTGGITRNRSFATIRFGSIMNRYRFGNDFQTCLRPVAIQECNWQRSVNWIAMTYGSSLW